MIAAIGAACALLLYVLVAPPPRRRKGPDLGELQYQRDKALQRAERNAVLARDARHNARGMARELQRFQWDAEFRRAAGDPLRADRLAAACPRRERLLVRHSENAQYHDAQAAEALQESRTLAKQLARATPRVRPQAGLVTLARVCWRGWLVSRRNSMLY